MSNVKNKKTYMQNINELFMIYHIIIMIHFIYDIMENKQFI